jgi:predicted MFS family arabinose efflux permease
MAGSGSVTRVSGPGLGGLVSQAVGAPVALACNAASYLASAICLLVIRQPLRHEPRSASKSSIRQEIKEGISFVVHDDYLRSFMVWSCVNNIGLAGYFALIVVFLVRSVGLSAGATGVILTVGGLGGFGASLLTRQLAARFGSARTLLITGAVSGPCGLLIVAASRGPRLTLAVLGIVILEGGVVLCNIILQNFQQIYCPPEILGRVLTSTQIVAYGSAPLGALVAGTLAEVLGPRLGLLIMLGTEAAGVLLLFFSPLVGRRDLPTATQQEAIGA